MSSKIVLLILGESYIDSIVLLKIMSVLPLVIIMSNLYAIQGLYALGCQKIVSGFVVKIAVVHLLYLFFMIYYYGMIGATISVVITEVLITIFSIIKFNQIIRKAI